MRVPPLRFQSTPHQPAPKPLEGESRPEASPGERPPQVDVNWMTLQQSSSLDAEQRRMAGLRLSDQLRHQAEEALRTTLNFRI